MASRITLTIACDDFDHIRALMDGSVKPEGIEPVFITVLTNPERHGRMVRELAFDVCELNLPTYLIARDSGVPITAISFCSASSATAMSTSIRSRALPSPRT